jgi:hypothetical protein
LGKVELEVGGSRDWTWLLYAGAVEIRDVYWVFVDFQNVSNGY